MIPWWWLVAARPHNASELAPTPSWPMMAIPKLELLSIMSQLDHQKEGDDDGVLIASVMWKINVALYRRQGCVITSWFFVWEPHVRRLSYELPGTRDCALYCCIDHVSLVSDFVKSASLDFIVLMSKVTRQLLGQQQYRHLTMDGLRPPKLKLVWDYLVTFVEEVDKAMRIISWALWCWKYCFKIML